MTREQPSRSTPARGGLYKRFFAWLVAKLDDHYGEEVDERKRRLFRDVEGTVVEIGAGAGANLPFFPPGVHVVAIEPNPYMHPYLQKDAERLGVDVEIRTAGAEGMDVGDESADFVVCTLVLCSVDDIGEVLREVLRVLKPGGRFIFVEHVAAPAATRLRSWQRRLRPLWIRIGDGCCPDRETWKSIEAAGFSDLELEHFDSRAIPLVRPHIAGVATK